MCDLEKNEEHLLINQNEFSDDGTIAITNFFPDREEKYLAYTLAHNGSDRQEIHIFEIEKKKDIEDKLNLVKFTNVVWDSANKGFYYIRFPEVGTVAKEDKLIYKNDERKELNYRPILSNNDDYIILSVSKGTAPENGIYYRKVDNESSFAKLFEVMEAEYNFIEKKCILFHNRQKCRYR